jgi:hypothetical protein
MYKFYAASCNSCIACVPYRYVAVDIWRKSLGLHPSLALYLPLRIRYLRLRLAFSWTARSIRRRHHYLPVAQVYSREIRQRVILRR